MADQTDANSLAELARHLRDHGFDPKLGVVIDLHGAPITLGPDGTPLPETSNPPLDSP